MDLLKVIVFFSFFVGPNFFEPKANQALFASMIKFLNSSAKFSSGLSVYDFYKRISYINLSKKGIATLGPSVITLAKFEGLEGHARSIKFRLGRN